MDALGVTVEEALKIGELDRNLASPSRALRLATLRVLCVFPSLHYVDAEDEVAAAKAAEAAAGGDKKQKKNKKQKNTKMSAGGGGEDEGPTEASKKEAEVYNGACGLLRDLLQIEETPVSMAMERERTRLMANVATAVASRRIPPLYVSLLPHFFVGQLQVRDFRSNVVCNIQYYSKRSIHTEI